MFVNEYSVRVVWRVFEQRGYEVLVSVVRCVCVCVVGVLLQLT